MTNWKFIKTVAVLFAITFSFGCQAQNSSGDAAAPGCCGMDNGNNDGSGNEEMNLGNARYRVTFDASWSSTTHPTNFPSNPHFSGLVGAVHNSNVKLWNRGGFATDGIESMAETGSKTKLLSEVSDLIQDGTAMSEISGGGIPLSPGTSSVEFDVTSGHPLVSIVSMLAPSPDWFVGVSAMSLVENEQWVNLKVVNLALYDSGTDNGDRFTSSNSNTMPAQTIERLTSALSDTDFVDGKDFVGTFTFERIDN